MQITLNTESLKRIEKLLEKTPKDIPKALSRAVNEAANKGKTMVSRTVRASYNVKAKEIAATLSVVRSSPGTLSAYLNYRGMKFPLKRFQAGGKSSRKGPVTIQELRGKRTTLAEAFNVDKFGGNIFVRTSKKRFPLKQLMGLSVPAMVSGQRLNKQVEDVVQKTFNERAVHAAEVIANDFNTGKA
jgi:hypothetical protein